MSIDFEGIGLPTTDTPNAGPAPTAPAPAGIATTGTGSPEKRQAPKRSGPLVNVYTAMLMLSALFLGVACLLLWIEFGRYNFEFRPSGTLRSAGGETAPP